MRRVTRIQEIGAVIRGQRPVVMLTRTIDARKGLLMKEAGHAVASGHLLQCLHDNLVVVNSLVYTLVDRRKLMLGRSHLVVLCLGRHAQLPKFFIHIVHVGTDPLTDGAKVMVLQLLPLGRHGSKKGAPGVNQVLAL